MKYPCTVLYEIGLVFYSTKACSNGTEYKDVTCTFIVFAGVNLIEMPVLLWRWKVFNGVEVEFGLKIICRTKKWES